MNISKIIKVLSSVTAVAVFVLISGNMSEANAQRDPFKKPGYAKPQINRPKINPGNSNPSKPGKKAPTKPKGPMVVQAPPIEARIDYYKRVREEAAMNGQPLPKVTSVLLVNEMSVTGIFRTPRGYAAMVEATPIKLSYTIYPGEKFFDGQLVAVEENRLIFRKVTKWSNNKFVSSVHNMPLRKYSLQQDIQGTSPSGESYKSSRNERKTEAASNGTTKANKANANPAIIVSPLEEMNSQPVDEGKDSAKGKKRGKKGKKRASKRKRS